MNSFTLHHLNIAKMYGIDSREEIPIACRTEQVAWDELISRIWHTVLGAYGFTETCSVIEVGPGVSAKIGLALSRFNFKGDLYVVDSSDGTIRALMPKYQVCLPNANIHYIQDDLSESLSTLPKRADFLLASHVLDDMLMSEWVKQVPARHDPVFSWSSTASYAPAVTDAFRAQWDAFQNDSQTLSAAKASLKQMWLHAVEMLKPSCVIMSQYPSATLFENGLDSLNRHTHEIFSHIKQAIQSPRADQELQQALNTLKHYNHPHIGNHILNAAYWALYRI